MLHECRKEKELDMMLERVNRLENTLFGVDGNNGLHSRIVRLEQSVNGWWAVVDKVVVALLGGAVTSIFGYLANVYGVH